MAGIFCLRTRPQESFSSAPSGKAAIAGDLTAARGAATLSRTAALTSSSVIRPWGPLPLTADKSTPNSRAKRRVAGPAGGVLPVGAASTAVLAADLGRAAGFFAWPSAPDLLAAWGRSSATSSSAETSSGSTASWAVAVAFFSATGEAFFVSAFASGAAALSCLAAPPATASTVSNGSPTLTFEPFCTCTLVMRPAKGQGSSTTALPVSISMTFWSATISSPSLTITLTISPSSTFSPRSGTLNSCGHWSPL